MARPVHHQEVAASRVVTARTGKRGGFKAPSGERRIGVPVGIDTISRANPAGIPRPIESTITSGITRRGLRKCQRLVRAVEDISNRNSSITLRVSWTNVSMFNGTLTFRQDHEEHAVLVKTNLAPIISGSCSIFPAMCARLHMGNLRVLIAVRGLWVAIAGPAYPFILGIARTHIRGNSGPLHEVH